MTQKKVKEKTYSYEEFRNQFYKVEPESWDNVRDEADAWAKVLVESITKKTKEESQRQEFESIQQRLSKSI